MLNRRAVKLAIGVLFGWVQSAAFAAVCFGEAGAEPDSKPAVTPDNLYPGVSPADTMWMVVKVIFFLLLIIGIFYYIMKFIAKKNRMLPGRSIRSLGGVALGPNKSIQVVEIGKSLYVVGVGQEVQLLEKIDNEADVAYLTEMMTSGPAVPSAGFETIGGLIRKLRSKSQPEEEEMELSASFQEVFHNKMQHMTDRKKRLEDMLMEDNKQDRLNDK